MSKIQMLGGGCGGGKKMIGGDECDSCGSGGCSC